MMSFRSAVHAQRFSSVHGLVQNLFGVEHHLLRCSPPLVENALVPCVASCDVWRLTAPDSDRLCRVPLQILGGSCADPVTIAERLLDMTDRPP
jgi:hypothetical protein